MARSKQTAVPRRFVARAARGTGGAAAPQRKRARPGARALKEIRRFAASRQTQEFNNINHISRRDMLLTTFRSQIRCTIVQISEVYRFAHTQIAICAAGALYRSAAQAIAEQESMPQELQI
jgi:hypothetical protein